MLVNLNRTLLLEADQQEAWCLLRDTRRLAGLMPGVEGITSENGASGGTGSAVEKHVAEVAEKVGPFRLKLKLAVTILRAEEPLLIEAELNGADARSENRVSGTLRAELKERGPAATLLSVEAAVEVIGKLASLGAAPIRKKADELFEQFIQRLKGEFRTAAEGPAA
jgi:carbon monoxide dehydrogenase subunit G